MALGRQPAIDHRFTIWEARRNVLRVSRSAITAERHSLAE